MDRGSGHGRVNRKWLEEVVCRYWGTQGRTLATGHLEDRKVTEKSSKFEKAWSILKVKGRHKTESHDTQ